MFSDYFITGLLLKSSNMYMYISYQIFRYIVDNFCYDGRRTYATFTPCSRRPPQSRFMQTWTKRDGRETTRGNGMGKRDRP